MYRGSLDDDADGKYAAQTLAKNERASVRVGWLPIPSSIACEKAWRDPRRALERGKRPGIPWSSSTGKVDAVRLYCSTHPDIA